MENDKANLQRILLEANNKAVKLFERQPYKPAQIELTDTGDWRGVCEPSLAGAYDVSVSGETPQEAADRLLSAVSALPSKAERDRLEIQRSLGDLIDLCNDAGIEAEFVNPLTQLSKKLSENAITYKKEY